LAILSSGWQPRETIVRWLRGVFPSTIHDKQQNFDKQFERKINKLWLFFFNMQLTLLFCSPRIFAWPGMFRFTAYLSIGQFAVVSTGSWTLMSSQVRLNRKIRLDPHRPYVIAPRGFTSLPTQEAEYSFSGFIPTNKQTNKGLTPSTQPNLFPKLLCFLFCWNSQSFHLHTREVSRFTTQKFLEQVHSARSSCTAPERVRKRSKFGQK